MWLCHKLCQPKTENQWVRCLARRPPQNTHHGNVCNRCLSFINGWRHVTLTRHGQCCIHWARRRPWHKRLRCWQWYQHRLSCRKWNMSVSFILSWQRDDTGFLLKEDDVAGAKVPWGSGGFFVRDWIVGHGAVCTRKVGGSCRKAGTCSCTTGQTEKINVNYVQFLNKVAQLATEHRFTNNLLSNNPNSALT